MPDREAREPAQTQVKMSGGNNERQKRVRLFGPDPLPNVVFSLDTSRQALPLHLFSQQAPCSEARISPTAPGQVRAATTTAEEDFMVVSSGDAAAQHPPRLAPGVQLYSGAKAVRSASRDANEHELLAVRHSQPALPATPEGTQQPPLAFGHALSNGVTATATLFDSGLLRGDCESRSSKSAHPTHDARAAEASLYGSTARSSEKDISTTSAAKEKSSTTTTAVVVTTAAAAAVAIAAPAQTPGELRQQHAQSSTAIRNSTTTTSRAEPADERAATHRAGDPKHDTETASVPVDTLLPGTAAGNATPRTDEAGGANEIADAAGKGRVEETAPSQGRRAGSAAASMVASFLKRGLSPAAPAPSPTTAAPAAGSPALTRKDAQGVSSSSSHWSTSPPATPTPLASLVTGVPPGSGGSPAGHVRSAGSCDRQRWQRNPSGIGDGALPDVEGGVREEVSGAATGNGVRSPHRVAGGSRFFNDEWGPRLKERRRIVRFPKRNEPAGTRILYWVRGNYRVRDNLALSVAMWLSTKLRMPLQAVTFVDPAIGRSAPTRPFSAKRARGADGAHGAEKQLPFRMAVEASALCEMEEALRALNVPLVAIACGVSEVPAALARWCGASRGCGGERASSDSPAYSPASAAAAAAAAAAASTGLSTEGSVHVAIADESYHPQQLLLMERAKEALGGVALYTVESSCVCPVNTYRGGRAAAAATGPGDLSSLADFRQAQEELLPTVCTELVPRPRLPLEAQLQHPVLADKDRAILSEEFEHGARLANSSAVVVNWGALREVSARRFPGFGKPMGQNVASSTKDLIAILGGGERVGEAALRQTLDMAIAAPPDRPEAAGSVPGSSRSDERVPQETCTQLESEVAGLGFGGSLLHLLRLGSISSLYIVQSVDAGHDRGEQRTRRSPRGLVDAVLRREYALHRSFSFYQLKGRRRAAVTATPTSGGPLVAQCVWRAADWMEIVPAWVWEELRRGQRDTRQHQHSPGDIRSAGSTLPSSVHDGLFSAIQARLANGGRLHPTLTPYWARTVIEMMLIPSQAISLVVDLMEELCIGASHAGDVVPDLFACALDAFKDIPNLAITPSGTGAAGITAAGSVADGMANAATNTPRGDLATARETPVFRRLADTPLASVKGLQSAFGGVDALARFMLPELQPVPTGEGNPRTT